MRRFIAAWVIASLAGCAHFGDPPPTMMVEVHDPPPPTTQRREERPWSERKKYLVTGLIFGIVGVGLTGGGAAAYATEQRQQQEDDANCVAQGGWLCGIADGFYTVPGKILVSIGAVHLGAALCLAVAGVTAGQ